MRLRRRPSQIGTGGMSLALVLLLAAPVVAQALPAACLSIPRRSGLRFVPQDSAWVAATSSFAQLFEGGPPVDLPTPSDRARFQASLEPVRTLWRSDSALAGHALASIITDDEFFTTAAAQLAAYSYRQLSGRALPILRELDSDPPRSRDYYALSAIERLDTPAERAIVFRRACDAGWLLIQLRRDEAYSSWAWSKANLHWPFAASLVLSEARRLLAGTQLETAMTQLRTAALPPEER